MILRDEREFTIECDIDDDFTRGVANVLAGLFSEYHLDEAGPEKDVCTVVSGIEFFTRYKRLN
jgi:hypothetical protein